MTEDDYPKRLLPDGRRELIVLPLTYGRARLYVGRPNASFYGDGW